MIGLIVALATESMVPAGWTPKQDFLAAAEYLAANRMPGDGIICLYIAVRPMNEFLGVDCEQVISVSGLIQFEDRHKRTSVVYTFPAATTTAQPAIWRKIQKQCRPMAEFEGTLNGGDINIMLKTSKSAKQYR